MILEIIIVSYAFEPCEDLRYAIMEGKPSDIAVCSLTNGTIAGPDK